MFSFLSPCWFESVAIVKFTSAVSNLSSVHFIRVTSIRVYCVVMRIFSAYLSLSTVCHKPKLKHQGGPHHHLPGRWAPTSSFIVRGTSSSIERHNWQKFWWLTKSARCAPCPRSRNCVGFVLRNAFHKFWKCVKMKIVFHLLCVDCTAFIIVRCNFSCYSPGNLISAQLPETCIAHRLFCCPRTDS